MKDNIIFIMVKAFHVLIYSWGAGHYNPILLYIKSVLLRDINALGFIALCSACKPGKHISCRKHTSKLYTY